jgi:excisionase family DNA binding protein
VPPQLAAPLLRVLVRALAREAREDGGIVPAGIGAFLAVLAAQADRPPAGFGSETSSAAAETVVVTVPEMARVMGASEQYVRRLCASGVLPARRPGGTWLIEVLKERLTDEYDHGTA